MALMSVPRATNSPWVDSTSTYIGDNQLEFHRILVSWGNNLFVKYIFPVYFSSYTVYKAIDWCSTNRNKNYLSKHWLEPVENIETTATYMKFLLLMSPSTSSLDSLSFTTPLTLRLSRFISVRSGSSRLQVSPIRPSAQAAGCLLSMVPAHFRTRRRTDSKGAVKIKHRKASIKTGKELDGIIG